jgi:3-phosphoshikimate 1-carboxyvinyltransferase
MAAAFIPGKVEIHVTNPGEKPWVALTLAWFDKLGISYNNQSFKQYTLNGPSLYNGFEYTVPGDFSSTTFLLSAALLTASTIKITDLDFDDSQGDKQFIQILQRMGAQINIDKNRGTAFIKGPQQLQGCSIDVNDSIDSLPILATLACFASTKTVLYNGAIAKNKESNRIKTISCELRKMGARIEEQEDGLIIHPSTLHGAQLNSHNDHRIAMALSIAALASKGESRIDDTECVAKSFTSFFEDLKSVGADIR